MIILDISSHTLDQVLFIFGCVLLW